MCVCRYDSCVEAMEVDKKPTETYNDIGGLDKQIEEVHVHGHSFLFSTAPPSSAPLLQLVEAIVLPMTHRDKFENIGIQPPKGKIKRWKITTISYILSLSLSFSLATLTRYGPPGTGKTLLARACAAQTKV